MRTNRLKAFIDSEAASALPLLAAAVLALVLANSPLAPAPSTACSTPSSAITYGGIGLAKPLLLWINDGLMAVFFLLVGLEIKREVVEGELSRPSQVALPIAGALGGMVVPAAIYVGLQLGRCRGAARLGDSGGHRHRLLAGRAGGAGQPRAAGAQVFLTTLAIVDDLGAIVIIADLLHQPAFVPGAGAGGRLHRGPRGPQPAGVRRTRPLHAGRRGAVGVRAGIGRACDAGGRRARACSFRSRQPARPRANGPRSGSSMR